MTPEQSCKINTFDTKNILAKAESERAAMMRPSTVTKARIWYAIMFEIWSIPAYIKMQIS